MRFNTEVVPLAHIDPSNEGLRMTTETRLDELTASIGLVGLINPPILRKNSVGSYTIICGFRRISACVRLGKIRIEARIVPSEYRPVDEVLLAVADNALQRPLNLIETSKAIAMLSVFFEDPLVLTKTASMLGLPGNQAFLKKVMPICRMPEPVPIGLIDGTLSLNTAVTLGGLSQKACIAFATLFNGLRLSQNKQAEILTLVKEISLREEISLEAVLSAESLCQILANDQLDRNQKGGKIRAYLKKRRFPEIVNTEKAFEANVTALKLGNGVKLIPPKDFEGTDYTLQFSFKRHGDLLDHRACMDEIIESPYLESILNI
jgi:ParB family chromosome partitioning protein